MNIVPYSESTSVKTMPSGQDCFQLGLYRPLCSEVFFSISRETLPKISDIRDGFLIGPASSSEILEIRLQRNPNAHSHCLIEIRDPNAKDLDRCQRVFLQPTLSSLQK